MCGVGEGTLLLRASRTLLDAWGVKHYLLESDADLGRIGEAWKGAQAASKPVAVLIGREYD